MAKAIELLPSTMTAPRKPVASETRKKPGPPPGEPRLAVQLRWPESDYLLMRRAALERDQSHSDFMLECFRAFMAKAKGKGSK